MEQHTKTSDANYFLVDTIELQCIHAVFGSGNEMPDLISWSWRYAYGGAADRRLGYMSEHHNNSEIIVNRSGLAVSVVI
ncbi:hypothetical protein Tco_0210440 [Tanacetum coccineum]